jgi:hypothetical protein
MKITNLSSKRIYLKDLKFLPESQTEGRRGEDQYLDPAGSIKNWYVYLPDTSEVLRSASKGDIKKLVAKNYISIYDTVTLAASPGPGNSVVINHKLGYMPNVAVYKQVGATWVDATGTMDLIHNDTFTSLTVSNPTAFALTFLIKVG